MGKESKDIGLDDIFTVADTTVQKTIEFNLKHFFPYINIVSEEEDENTKHIKPTLMPDQIHTDFITEDFLKGILQEEEGTAEEIHRSGKWPGHFGGR